MKISFRIPEKLWGGMQKDLDRKHPFASERVGFLYCSGAGASGGDWILLGSRYEPVADEDYEYAPRVGARIGAAAFRKALQTCYKNGVSAFHIHRHDHRGKPSFSLVDARESEKFVPDFFNVCPKLPHGALVLSLDSAQGYCWHPQTRSPIQINKFSVVGNPLRFF